MDPPFFSVIVAAYNPGERILSTIRSALAQSYREFELLAIGDGCSDATGEILSANFGDAVRWENLDRNHGSQSYPNNVGIERSRGTHIAYLGHDDIWAPPHLERLAALIRAADPDFAVSGAVYHTPPGSKYYQFTGVFEDPSIARRASSIARHVRAMVSTRRRWSMSRRQCESDRLRLPRRSTGIRPKSTRSTENFAGPGRTRIRSTCFRSG
jgi:glycosyltransferase involved in cell wall biosynthesis